MALARSGEVYTFGMNNKGQCGRDFPPLTRESSAQSAVVEAGAAPTDNQVEDESSDRDTDQDPIAGRTA